MTAVGMRLHLKKNSSELIGKSEDKKTLGAKRAHAYKHGGYSEFTENC